MVTSMKNNKFDTVDYEQWKEIATKSLKNLPFERLVTKTLEGIDLQPLYTKENHQHSSETLQAVREGIESPHWTIAQQTYATNSNEFIEKIKEALDKGNEAIVYDGRWPIDWESLHLNELAEMATNVPIYLFNIEADDDILEIFSLIDENDKEKVSGVYLGDKTLPSGFDNIRQAGIDLTELHLEGADIITELALTLSKAQMYAKNQDNFKEVTDQLFVRFSIDTHFFMEIAKLRAFRVLWKAFAAAYDEDAEKIPVFSETALRTYSKLDPYVNLLRAGNEAFSAALGGTDGLTVHPYNVISGVDEQSERYARNTQLVIREETHIQSVLDPAGGSYFIEEITKEMVEKAWNLFLEIEEFGGYEKYIASDVLKEKLNELTEKRLEKLATGEHVLVGATSFADLSEEVELNEKEKSLRLAKVYEDFRARFSENQPKTVLLGFGELKDYKPISDFVRNYLASAGIETVESPSFESIEAYRTWRESNDFDYGIICTPKDKVNAVVEQVASLDANEKIIDVAGKYQEEFESTWKQQGIHGLVYRGQNQLDKFTTIEKRLKEVGRVE